MAEINERLNLVLLGKIGAGKSASGNTILGRQAFESKGGFTSVTQDVVVESGTVCGQQVTVYDTPGLYNTKRTDAEIQQIHASVLQECESGHCVFLMVIKVGRFTEKETKTVEMIEKLLGEKHLKKTWILFTGKDKLEEDMTIETFINETKALKKLVQKYDQRYHVFNNKITGQATQVQELLTKIYRPTAYPDTIGSTEREDDLRIVLLGKTGVGKSEALYDKERKKREEEFNEREERYKTLLKEKEESEGKMREEMKREREEWEKQRLEEKMRREEDEKRREKEQKDWAEFNQRLQQRERMEREKKDLQSKHEERIMKIIEEERINSEKEKMRKEKEFREREEQYIREMIVKEIRMRNEMKREQEEWEKPRLEEKTRRKEGNIRRVKDICYSFFLIICICIVISFLNL